MAVSLTRLRSFIAVAEERQFRRASERIGISQPALSAHIRDLEQDLGVALFNRTTRNVRLTAEGETFLHRARRVLEDLNAAVIDVRERAQLKRGRVVIAATPTVASQVLPPVIVSFARQFAGVRTQVLEAIASEVERLVASGQADFGIGPRPEGRSELAFRVVFRERLCGVLPIGHEFAARRRVRLGDLARYPLLTTAPGSAIYESIELVLRERAIKVSTDHVLDLTPDSDRHGCRGPWRRTRARAHVDDGRPSQGRGCRADRPRSGPRYGRSATQGRQLVIGRK